MRFTKYSKRIPSPWDELSLEELLDALSDYLLGSGFDSYGYWARSERTLDALREAILNALVEMELLTAEDLEQMLDERGNPRDEKLQQLIDQIVRKLIDEGYLSFDEDPFGPNGEGFGRGQPQDRTGRRDPYQKPRIHFEITDKSIDFLGYRSLRKLMGSLGRASFGRHDTTFLSTGVEATHTSKPYEFGDVMNLDVSATLLGAIKREGLGVPLALDYKDLMVHQAEYQSSCATVLMLDCSHSMILYGEDRFTPAKKVALALTHLIRSQYPGDSIRLVLFHDSAEELPLAGLARLQVGPYHTNTCEGLRLSRRILESQRKEMKQIVMITDGKPSALTMSDGTIYKNPFGLDPYVLEETYREAAYCRRAGIMVNTFMLTDDYYLVDFVKKLTEICKGKAYFTTIVNLGEYVLMDYLRRKTEKIH